MENVLIKMVSGSLIVIGAIVLIALFFTLPMYFLWNWLMPEIFGLKVLTLWQALGVSLLSNLIFKTTAQFKK